MSSTTRPLSGTWRSTDTPRVSLVLIYSIRTSLLFFCTCFLLKVVFMERSADVSLHVHKTQEHCILRLGQLVMPAVSRGENEVPSFSFEIWRHPSESMGPRLEIPTYYFFSMLLTLQF